jgi:hypothetical protein
MLSVAGGKGDDMDLLLIPVLLSLGGGLIYLSLNGAPKVSLEKVPFGFKRDPFKLNDWMSKRPNTNRKPGNRITAEDAELVDLMNDMIAVREQLTDLQLARAPRPIRRRQGRKPATTPVVTVELSVAVDDETPVVVRETLTRHEVIEAEPVHVEIAAAPEASVVEQSPAIKESTPKLPHPVKASSERPALPKDLLEQARAKAAEEKAAGPAPEKAVEKAAEQPLAAKRAPVEKSIEQPLAAKQAPVEKQPAEKASEKQTAARRPSYSGHNRRYVRI